MSTRADGWNVGAFSSPEIFAALAARIGKAVEDVEAHARDCCRLLAFNETAWRVATAWRNVGGAGYWFQSDDRFTHDLPRLVCKPSPLSPDGPGRTWWAELPLSQ